jgi:K+-sensing histidine kinase KdpD
MLTKNNKKFLKNIQDELLDYVTEITEMMEELKNHYDDLEEYKKLQNIEQINLNSEGLNFLINNIIDLSKVQSDCKLLIDPCNLSNLLYERIYIRDSVNKSWNFQLNIEKDILVNCDKYYMARVLDNIIIISTEYCVNNDININLYRTNNGLVEFIITEQELSVTKKYLDTIFNPSMNNVTKNKILDIRILLCQKIIESHEGSFWSKTCPKQGVTFAFTMPLVSMNEVV